MGDENIKFPAIKPRQLVAPRPTTDQRLCNHQSLELDPAIRLILCTGCGLWMDPFDYLMKWASKEVVLNAQVKRLTGMQQTLIESVTELAKEEKRIKARIRTAKHRSKP